MFKFTKTIVITFLVLAALTLAVHQFDNPTMDPDALAFIQSAHIKDPAQKAAINSFVVDMKTADLWDKIETVWIGGTHNLKGDMVVISH